MNRFLLVLVVIVAGVIGLGFYMKWLNVTTDGSDEKTHINLTVDKDKFKEDEKKAVDKVKSIGQQAKDKVAGPSEKTQDKASSSAEPPQN